MKRLLLLGGVLLALVLTGCGKSDSADFDKLRVFSGESQCALPGEDYSKPLIIEAVGAPDEGFLSDPSLLAPIAGVKVKFEAEGDSDFELSENEGITDAGGLIYIDVTAGKQIGDQYLKIIPVDYPERAISVRFVCGVAISGADQEGKSGEMLKDPLIVKVVKSDGSPASNVPVYFGITDDAKFTNDRVYTDEKGEAVNNVILGKGTGTFSINLEVAGSEGVKAIRGLQVRALGVNIFWLVINVFGGLAIFIYGMKLMSDGLHKVAGKRMRNILHFFASNRYVAIIAGAAVTAVIQSSSATTVMVIGFVNAGLLNLVQSIGIIFGANIGTTITAQIIAFDIGAIIMPAIIIGLVMMFINWKGINSWGETVLGLGMLFFGMIIMSGELTKISEFPTFVNFFSSFDCAPIDGWMPFGSLLGAVGIGLAVTVVIQSSSAATGIILALGASGLINLYTAVALVLGSNIGTTITAQLAAIPANRIAKQTALAHTLFNVIGVVIIGASFYIPWKNTGIPIFFYFINSITSGDAFAAIPQNVPRHIANAHTAFNVLTTIALIPFIGIMAKICQWVIPIKKDADVKYQHFEPHLLDTPSIALNQVVKALQNMVRESWNMVDVAANDHFLKSHVDEDDFKELADREAEIDNLQVEMTNYLVQITRRKLTYPQSELIPLLMHSTNDAERVADHTENILELTRRIEDAPGEVSEKGLQDLNKMLQTLDSLAENVIIALESGDTSAVHKALAAEAAIQMLAVELEEHHINRLREGKCGAVVGVIYIEFVGELSKVGGALSNIAERAAALQSHYQRI